ncbi:MAG: MATE family efflux transporter [Lachnospiraceae bacterium]|nr:MATE family efflux transporter [Lachnospiraceae bacterium]
MEKDMTVGKPASVIINFTIPILIGNVFQQFYNMADAIIVGRCVGNRALAAVGSTGTFMFLIYGLVTGMTVGFTVSTAQRFGAGDMDGMRKSVASAIKLAAIVTAIMTALTMIFMRPMLHLMNTPSDIFDDAYSYIMVICAGIAAQVLYNMLSAILRALGNSRTPLYFLILSALLNIGLDLVFIKVFGMGAAGAAYATVVSQLIAGIASLIYIIAKVPLLHLKKEDWAHDGVLVRNQLKVGFPMALQYSITAIGTTMVQAALNKLGSTAVASYTAAGKIEQIAGQAYVAIGTTMATYCAQNRGAGRIDRIKDGFKSATCMGFIYSIIAGALIFFFGKYMTYLFVTEDISEVIGYVDTYLRCISLFFIPLTIVNVHRNGIQGMGFGILPMMAGVAELIGRGVASVVAAHYRSYIGICMGGPAAWVLAAALLIWMYHMVIRKLEKKVHR